MDISWADRIELFQFALMASLLAGFVCPLVGVFLLVRRTSFYGIALPQFATAGVVFGFVVLPFWVEHFGLAGMTVDQALNDSHAAMNYHLAWAAVFTFGGLLALVFTGRGQSSEVGRVAAAFAIATAATYLFGRMSPVGKGHGDELMQGEVLGIGQHELETLACVFGFVLVVLVWFHRDLVLVSYDRETARVLGKRVTATEALLNLLTGLTVSAGTMTLGPTMLFGLLVLPPLAARRWANSMTQFFVVSSVLGALAVVVGIAASFQFDLPLGPAIVGAAALELVPGALLGKRKS